MNTGIEIYKFVDKVQQHFNADEDIFETLLVLVCTEDAAERRLQRP